MSQEPENLVLQLLRDIRADMATKNDIVEIKSEMAELRSEMHSLRADVASDFIGANAKIDTTRQELSEQIVGLRRAVIEYHSAVIGHGYIISDLEARLRRVEQHLKFPEGH